MWTGLRTAAGFCKADFQESSQILDNPGRGWYHIYPFAAKPSPVPPEEEVYLAGGEERLALARIDIGAYRSRQLSDRALARIDSILDFFQANGKQVILRIAYDTSGKGLEREPETLDLVERHMEQVGDVLRPRGGGILVIQGIFVGNWGEMHGSRFLTDRSMARLLEAMYRSAGGCCPVAVRTPAQWRRARALADPAVRLALFNDGIFGSQTDLGTYGTSSRREAGEGAGWTREEELSWQAVHLECLPNGGEALAGPSPKSEALSGGVPAGGGGAGTDASELSQQRLPAQAAGPLAGRGGHRARLLGRRQRVRLYWGPPGIPLCHPGREGPSGAASAGHHRKLRLCRTL